MPHPGPGPGSSSRPTTRRRTSGASPPRSSRRCPGRRSSSSMTARPTGPARSPTSWRPPTRESGSITGPRSRASGGRISTASAWRSMAGPRRSSRWTPTGRTTRPCSRRWSARSSTGDADLVIGSRYTPGGGRRRLGNRATGHLARRQPVREDRARASRPNDLTGGFKAWRRTTLEAIPFDGVHAGGYVFQIEMTFRAVARRCPHPGGPDHVPRPARRPVEDEPPDRRRGAGRRRPAAGRGAARPADRAARPGPVTNVPGGRLGAGEAADRAARPVPGLRVVLDARPLQEPDRAPLTATYLDGLLGAYDADPLAGESFAFLLGSDLDDPTERFERLRRRRAPAPAADEAAAVRRPDRRPVRAVAARRSGSPGGPSAAGRPARSTTSSAAGRCRSPRAAGRRRRCSTSRRGSCRRRSSGRSPARFGHRLRAQLIRDAAAVIVGSEAVAAAARRLLHVRRDRLAGRAAGPAPGLRGADGRTRRAERRPPS